MATSLNDVMQALGRVQSTVDGLADELADEKISARESRAAVYLRLNEQAGFIGDLTTTVAVAAQADVQTREDIAALTASVTANHASVAPAVADWQQMKRVGIGLVGLLALGGLSIWSALAWAGEASVQAVRSWLRIN